MKPSTLPLYFTSTFNLSEFCLKLALGVVPPGIVLVRLPVALVTVRVIPSIKSEAGVLINN